MSVSAVSSHLKTVISSELAQKGILASDEQIRTLAADVIRNFPQVQTLTDNAAIKSSLQKTIQITTASVRTSLLLAIESKKDPGEHYLRLTFQGRPVWTTENDPRAKFKVTIFGSDSCVIHEIHAEQTCNYWEKQILDQIPVLFKQKTADILRDEFWKLAKPSFDAKNGPNTIGKPDVGVPRTSAHRIVLNAQKYIATCYPTSKENFWKMVGDERPAVIVKLEKEGMRYWPETEGVATQISPELSIKLIKNSPGSDFVERTIEVNAGGTIFTVTMLDFLKFPDFGTPEKNSFMHLLDAVERHATNKEQAVLVHCRGGMGRTGTFIAAHNAIGQVKMGEEPRIFSIVTDMRAQRPLQMVETDRQYAFVQTLVAETAARLPALPGDEPSVALHSTDTASASTSDAKDKADETLQAALGSSGDRPVSLAEAEADTGGVKRTIETPPEALGISGVRLVNPDEITDSDMATSSSTVADATSGSEVRKARRKKIKIKRRKEKIEKVQAPEVVSTESPTDAPKSRIRRRKKKSEEV